MHGPHDAECRATDFFEGLPAGDDLPQDDAPAEHVALLAVVTPWRTEKDRRSGGEAQATKSSAKCRTETPRTFKHLGRHPSCAAFVVSHVGLNVASGSKVTDLQHSTSSYEQQTETEAHTSSGIRKRSKQRRATQIGGGVGANGPKQNNGALTLAV